MTDPHREHTPHLVSPQSLFSVHGHVEEASLQCSVHLPASHVVREQGCTQTPERVVVIQEPQSSDMSPQSVSLVQRPPTEAELVREERDVLLEAGEEAVEPTGSEEALELATQLPPTQYSPVPQVLLHAPSKHTRQASSGHDALTEHSGVPEDAELAEVLELGTQLQPCCVNPGPQSTTAQKPESQQPYMPQSVLLEHTTELAAELAVELALEEEGLIQMPPEQVDPAWHVTIMIAGFPPAQQFTWPQASPGPATLELQSRIPLQ